MESHAPDEESAGESSTKNIKHLIPSKTMAGKDRAELKAWVDSFLKNHAGHYNPELINNMKRLKMARPDFIPKIDWERASGKLNPQETVVCYMAAWGIPPSEIAKQIGFGSAKVKEIIGSEIGSKRIEEVQLEVFGRDPKKWMESILPKAIREAEDIMTSKATKPHTRLEAAKYFIDRQMGKPVQKIENDSNMLRQLFDAMDGKNRKPDITVEFEDAEIIREVIPESPKDDVDRWVEKNL